MLFTNCAFRGRVTLPHNPAAKVPPGLEAYFVFLGDPAAGPVECSTAG